MTESCISAGSPCKEPDKLYVEVAGTDIHKGHGLVLEKDGEPVSQLTMEQKENHQLYQCDYAVSPGDGLRHTLTLTVDRLQGEPLRFPLQDEPRATRLSPRTQPNLLFPVYPLARLPRVQTEPGHALLRPGYLYVFWKGVLWRELQTDANGKLMDIDLAHWRDLAKQVAAAEDRVSLDNRPVAGVALDTLWVPARFQGVGRAEWTIGDVELAWSEQQWSWDYIESLESGLDIINLPASYRELTGIPAYGKSGALTIDARRQARCKNLRALNGYEHHRRFGPESHGGRGWLPLVEASPCRRRNPDREKNATDPFQVTQSLDGGGLDQDNSVLHRIRHELERQEGFVCKAVEVVDVASGLNRWMDDLIGADWRAQSVGQTGDGEESENDKAETARKEFLDEIRKRLELATEEEDQLGYLRERHIPAVLLPDVLFELEWLISQTSLHLTYLKAVAEATQDHPHFKSAMLVHSTIFDHRGYERGPFDEYRHAVDIEKLDEVLRKEERESCRATCYELIQRRIDLLESHAVPVLNDLFALNGLNYPIALQTLNPLLSNLETSVLQFDPLAGKVTREQEAYRDQAGAAYIKKLARGQTGMATFLTVDADKVPLDKALDDRVNEWQIEPNDGSGKPRPGLMQWLQNQTPDVIGLPEAMREQYELSDQERQSVVDNIAQMADPVLLRWAQVSYTTMGQLMADLSSEFYLQVQRALLRKIGDGPIYQATDTLQISTRYMKVGNPFMRGLKLGHANPMLANANPGMVLLGVRYGDLETGLARFSTEAINDALRQASGSQIVRPKGGVINRIGPGMEGNYAVIRSGNGKLIANATSVAGLQGSTPTVAVQVEMLMANEDSIAARMSQGLTSRASNAMMRWAPPGMLGVFGWNVLNSAQSVLQSISEGKAGAIAKDMTAAIYGVSNLMYWLGHIVEAENLARETRLSWLTRPRLEVAKIRNHRLRWAAGRLFTDKVLSMAKFAGVFGGWLEVAPGPLGRCPAGTGQRPRCCCWVFCGGSQLRCVHVLPLGGDRPDAPPRHQLCSSPGRRGSDCGPGGACVGHCPYRRRPGNLAEERAFWKSGSCQPVPASAQCTGRCLPLPGGGPVPANRGER